MADLYNPSYQSRGHNGRLVGPECDDDPTSNAQPSAAETPMLYGTRKIKLTEIERDAMRALLDDGLTA